jgi:hypothetical protein
MTEQEVSDAYKNRFNTFEEVENYIKNIRIGPSSDFGNISILGNIIIIPSLIDKRLINTTNDEDFSWINANQIDFEPSGFRLAPRNGYIPGSPRPSAFGVSCGEWIGNGFGRKINIHRNGCIQYVEDFGYHDSSESLLYQKLAVRLLHTLQFAQNTLTKYNYFGDVRIRVHLHSIGDSIINLPSNFNVIEPHTSSEEHIVIDRETSISALESSFSKISASIMDEIFNHYRLWKCYLFDENGDYIIERFARA